MGESMNLSRRHFLYGSALLAARRCCLHVRAVRAVLAVRGGASGGSPTGTPSSASSTGISGSGRAATASSTTTRRRSPTTRPGRRVGPMTGNPDGPQEAGRKPVSPVPCSWQATGIGRASLMQHAETTDIHPGHLIQDHEQRSPFGSSSSQVDELKGDLPKARTDLTRPTTYTSGRTPTDT